MSITVNPKYKGHPTIQKFEAWIRKNYTGNVKIELPKDVDLKSVFIYSIDGLKYGPIPLKKIPKSFKVEVDY